MARVLVIGERPEEAKALAYCLGLLGHESAPSASELGLALRSLMTFSPEIIVVDARKACARELFSVLREVSTTPIMVLATGHYPDDIAWYLEEGAIDCLARMVNPNVVSARISAALRLLNRGQRAEKTIHLGELEIDFNRRLVESYGKAVSLTPIEFRLLEALASNRDEVCSHRMLLEQVWGKDFTACSHYLRLYIGYLRQKLEKDPANPRLLVTERGRGYRLIASKPISAASPVRRARPIAI